MSFALASVRIIHMTHNQAGPVGVSVGSLYCTGTSRGNTLVCSHVGHWRDNFGRVGASSQP